MGMEEPFYDFLDLDFGPNFLDIHSYRAAP